MTFTCDRCHGEYHAQAGTASAFLFVKDSRCNHLQARCTRCGHTEVIFLGPARLEEAIRIGRLPITVKAEATSDLRVRAERAWAAAEHAGSGGSGGGRDRSGEGADHPAEEEQHVGTTGGGAQLSEVRQYPLTIRHEQLIATFGEILDGIPAELLWDAFENDHGREHPERWAD